MNWLMRRVSSGAVGVEGLAKAVFEGLSEREQRDAKSCVAGPMTLLVYYPEREAFPTESLRHLSLSSWSGVRSVSRRRKLSSQKNLYHSGLKRCFRFPTTAEHDANLKAKKFLPAEID